MFRENFKKTISMKILPVETELFEADRQTYRQADSQSDRQTDCQTDRQTDRQTDLQTDTPKLTVAFRNFEKGLKISH